MRKKNLFALTRTADPQSTHTHLLDTIEVKAKAEHNFINRYQLWSFAKPIISPFSFLFSSVNTFPFIRSVSFLSIDRFIFVFYNFSTYID